MKITERIALEVVSHEAIVTQAYKDSVGVLTWGVGITDASGHKVGRYLGKPQTVQHCLDVFIWALKRYADDVIKAFAPIVLNEHQLGGALSFHYNTGDIGRASWVKSFKAGDKTLARKQFMEWSKPKEIIPRRQKECDLFFDGKWSAGGKVLVIEKVTPKLAPDFKSGKSVDIRPDLEKIFYVETNENTGGAVEDKSDNPLIFILTMLINLLRKVFSK